MKRFLIISFLVLILLVLVGVGVVYYLLQPMGGDQAVRLVVPKGQAISLIAEELYQKKLIRHPLIFRLVVKVENLENKLQSGTFKLSTQMNVSELAHGLTQGTNDLWVTIPEGWRREEIAQSLASQDLAQFDQNQFLELSSLSEGYLFPDTYLIPREIDTKAMFNLLTRTFEQKVTQGLSQEISSSKHDLNTAMVVASLVEREALGAKQMPHIAGIIYHRLDLGMPLQIDATLQYAKGYSTLQKSWWVPPFTDDKKIDSPFNTYLHPDLPPRPICNPGLDAIKASLSPMKTDDLFYLHDRQGQIHYAKTIDEHNRNVNQYLR